MSTIVELFTRALLIGVGATMLMDAWAALLRVAGVPSLNLAWLGRWMGHMAHGRWTHSSIAATPPIPHEALIGWTAHHAIGVVFAALLLGTYGLAWAQAPSLTPALLIGIATVLAPWLILQPAMGAGIASINTPRPLFNALKSLVTHIVFGLGMYLAARVVALALPWAH